MPRMQRQSARTLARLQVERRARSVAPVDVLEATAQVFEQHMREVNLNTCIRCLRKNWTALIPDGICRPCQRLSNSGEELMFGPSNSMDIGVVPLELTNLTLIEQLLIARVHPIVSVFKIRGRQTAYSGHTMNFAQHITTIAVRLPHNVTSLDSVILMSRDTPHGIAHFRVRAAIVRRALIWLKLNNQYYSDIFIDELNLSALPSDGDVSHLLQVLPGEASLQVEDLQDQGNNIIESSGVPNIPAVDPAAAIDRGLEHLRQSPDPLQWPDLSQNPLNEFSTEGIICKAFPCLFPYGRGDLHAPRIKKITPHKYFSYLMDYHDGRFANDIRFPYYAYNTVARWDALNYGNVFIRNHHLNNTTLEELRTMANDDNIDIASQIMYYGASIRGTRSFWRARSSELLAMVRQLGTPTIFFTLSAADYHWPDLFRILKPHTDPNTISERERAELMHNNPMITAKFFELRCDVFIKKVLMKIFPVVDFWYRFEWQHRGSPHIHGLLWFSDAPDCMDIGALNDAGRQNVVNYFDQIVNATIDERVVVDFQNNPCRERFTDLNNEAKSHDLNRLLTQVQTHSRCGAHCLRKRRGRNIQQCRYGFPIPLEETSTLRQEDGFWKFFPKRNDERIQRYNKFVTQIWRGNTDFSAITSHHAVLAYISKYASKGEVSSESYSEIFKRAVNASSQSAPATLVRQLILGSVAERNYSAQEVMHLLQGWPLYHGSRTFIPLPVSERWNRVGAERSLITNYASREGLEDVNLYNFAKSFRKSTRGPGYIARDKDAVVRVIPFTKPSEDFIENETHYKYQCKLYIPWRDNFENIKPIDTTWEDLFNESIVGPPEGTVPEELPLPEEIEFDDHPLDRAQIVRDAGMAAARIHPTVGQQDPLGLRPIDEHYEWPELSSDFNESHVRTFFQQLRNAPIIAQARDGTTIPFDRMSPAQQEVLELCRFQLNNDEHPVKRVLVQGKAGTGKSAVIKAMCSMIEESCIDVVTTGSVFEVLAPTGAAALNVDGKTIHRFFHLPLSSSNEELPKLNGETLRNFQLQCKNLKFIIIDEYSMVGQKLLTKIHNRLQELRPGNTEPFAGFNIYFFGDIRQLPPVMDRAIYQDVNPNNISTHLAPLLIGSFQRKIALSVCHRQSADQVHFKELLDAIARGRVNRQHFEYLTQRRTALPYDRREWADAIHLFPTNDQVKQHNIRVLATNQMPVVHILAEHNNAVAVRGEDQLAQGMSKELFLSLGCRVMLRKNLDVARGLVNGSLGTVREIIYKSNERPPALPYVIMVEFDRYTGPCIRDRTYPILPVSVGWKTGGTDCTRKQFPITLAYAITIHKSQGLTLDKAIVDIGSKENTPGLSYVALSRVRRYSDFLLANSFDFSRLATIGSSNQVQMRERFLQNMNIEV